MQNGQPFKVAIEHALQSEGVPKTLYYMSLVESGFLHHAYSPAKASGPWQFLKDTGQQYGLKSNNWIDERRDPVKSTHAAAAYLRDLRQKFGDWYLTLAAYNGGPRTVNDAIKKGETNDFWKLKKAGLFKKETGEFVPKVIAAAILGSDPLKFGFPSRIFTTGPKFPESVIELKEAVKIRELAQRLSIPLAKLKEWNPELLKEMTPPKKYSERGIYSLRVEEEYVAKFAQIESKLTYIKIKEFHIHRIVKGDTLGKLAKRYNVPVKTILQSNPEIHSRKIPIGSKITVPILETHS
jgi:membrane-bound lytic murein transglycosylase D